MSRKTYVISRYDGGKEKIILTISEDMFSQLFFVKKLEPLTTRMYESSDVHFSAEFANHGFGFWKGSLLFWKRVLGFLNQEDIVLLRIKMEVEKLERTVKKKRDRMLYLIRGVDDYINTLNGRTK